MDDLAHGAAAARPPAAGRDDVLTDLLRPLTVAAANAARRSRVELTIFRPEGGVEAHVWFGTGEEERRAVGRVAAAWGRVDRARALGVAPAGTRPPATLIERAIEPALPPDLRDGLLAIGRRAATLVPLVIDGAVVGRLSTWSPEDERPLAQSALLALLALGEQAGMVVRDTRRLAAAERRLAEQTALLHVASAIDPDEPLPRALASLARTGLGIGGAAGATLELLLPGGQDLVVAADEAVATWTTSSQTGTRHPLAAATAIAEALRSGEPHAYAAGDPALGPRLGERYRARRAAHVLVVPLPLDHRRVGTALLAWREQSAPPPNAVSLGRELAIQLGIALDRLRLAAALRLRSDLDRATGLPNQRAMRTQLQFEIARAARYGEHFSVAIVRPQEPAPDATLSPRTTGELLRSTLRSADWVGRVADDAFLLLLPETNAEQAIHVANRLQARAAGATPAPRSLGIGIAAYPEDGETADALIAQAAARGGASLPLGETPTETTEPAVFADLESLLVETVD